MSRNLGRFGGHCVNVVVIGSKYLFGLLFFVWPLASVSIDLPMRLFSCIGHQGAGFAGCLQQRDRNDGTLLSIAGRAALPRLAKRMRSKASAAWRCSQRADLGSAAGRPGRGRARSQAADTRKGRSRGIGPALRHDTADRCGRCAPWPASLSCAPACRCGRGYGWRVLGLWPGAACPRVRCGPSLGARPLQSTICGRSPARRFPLSSIALIRCGSAVSRLTAI